MTENLQLTSAASTTNNRFMSPLTRPTRLRPGFRLIAALCLTITMAGSFVGSNQAMAAGQQSCLSGNTCVSWVGAGSVYNGYSSTNNPDFKTSHFNNGVAVGNNAGYGRNRDSAIAVVCFWGGPAGAPLTPAGRARYNGYTWELIQRTAESSTGTSYSQCLY